MLRNGGAGHVESVIELQIHALLSERSLPVRALSAKDKLSDTLGLSSLDLATLVAELELALGVDPFAELVPITSIRTVGDLARAYHLALLPDAAAPKDEQGLASAVARAQLRRAKRDT